MNKAIKTKGAKILLVGKGGKGAGMGHLVRLSSLHDVFTPRYDTAFLVNNDKLGIDFVKRKNHRFYTYEDYNELMRFVKKSDTYDFVIFDMLHIPANILKAVGNYCRFLIIFDDMQRLVNKKIEAEIICPQETFKNRTEFKNGHYILRGADYFPLRNSFMLQRKHKIFRNGVKDILISLGGMPPAEHSLLLVKLLDNYLNKGINIHVAPGYDAEKIIRTFSRRVIWHKEPNNIAGLITKSDLGIITSGFVKFEFMCIGTPFLTVSRNSHQKALAEKFSSKGYGIYLGGIKGLKQKPEIFYKRVERLVNSGNLRKKMCLRSRKLIDGRGNTRILKLINDLKRRRI